MKSVHWRGQTWTEGQTEGDLTAAEAFFLEGLIGAGAGLVADNRFDPTSSFASLLGYVAVLEARASEVSVPEAWTSLAHVPAGQIVAALTVSSPPEVDADDLKD